MERYQDLLELLKEEGLPTDSDGLALVIDFVECLLKVHGKDADILSADAPERDPLLFRTHAAM